LERPLARVHSSPRKVGRVSAELGKKGGSGRGEGRMKYPPSFGNIEGGGAVLERLEKRGKRKRGREKVVIKEKRNVRFGEKKKEEGILRKEKADLRKYIS